MNNQFFNNRNLNHQVVFLVSKIIGCNLIKVTIVETVNILSTNRNIRQTKKVPRQDRDFSTRLNYAKKR